MKRRRRQTRGAALKRGRPADGDGDSWYEQPASDGVGVPPATATWWWPTRNLAETASAWRAAAIPRLFLRDYDDAADEVWPVGDDDFENDCNQNCRLRNKDE